MSFDGEYFQEDFGIIMGTCEAAILASKYMAMLKNEFRKKCVSDPNLKWPTLFFRFLNDGFGIFKKNKNQVEYWINQFNQFQTFTG